MRLYQLAIGIDARAAAENGELRKLFDGFLRLLALGSDRFVDLRLLERGVFRLRRLARPFDLREIFHQRVENILRRCSVAQTAQNGVVVGEHIVHLLCVRQQIRKRRRLIEELRQLRADLADLRRENALIVLRQRRCVGVCLRIQPAQRIGLSLDPRVNCAHELTQRIVTIAPAVGIDEAQKIAVLRRCIGGIEGIRQRFLAQDRGRRFWQDLERRIQPEHMVEAPQLRNAEGVHRRNVRLRQDLELVNEKIAVPALGFADCLRQPLTQARLHLAGSSVGESDDEHMHQLHVVMRQHIDDAVDEDARFSRAGSGRDQQIFAARSNGFLLMWCVIHASSSSPASCALTSGHFTGAIVRTRLPLRPSSKRQTAA